MELLPGPRTPPARLTILAAAFVAAACALFATVGADAEWLAALGRDIARSWSIPSGVPFAAASSAGWHNVPVLGELVFHWLEAGLGTRGLLFAQLAAVVVCFWLVSVDMRRARVADQPAALVMMLVAFAATPALLIVRSQLFSLALFPVLLLLLREQVRRPSRRVWLVVPLVALWTNLHGGVLLGVAIAGAYLIFARARQEPLVAAGVLGGMVAALFVTPALFETASYYRGVVGSVAASDGEGMWRPLSLHAPFDVLFLVVAVPLVLLALRSKPALWEAVVIAGLAVVAVRASRNEVWLALFVAVPAARALTGRRVWGPVAWSRLVLFAAGFLAAFAIVGLVQKPPPVGASEPVMDEAAKLAGPTPILADGVNAEALALAGHRILIGNPLDAFARSEQKLYLDWLAGKPSGDAELRHTCVVVVAPGSLPDLRLQHDRDFVRFNADRNAVLYGRDCRLDPA